MKFKSIVALLLITTALSFSSCKGDNGHPLLSTLLQANSMMVVLLKGTYASDGPLESYQINNNQIFTDAEDTGMDLSGIPAYNQLPIYIDIGEIRLSTREYGNGLWSIDSAKDAKTFWDVVSGERQVYCSQPYSISLDNDTCFQTGGLVNYMELMNGNGAIYPSHDVGPGVYLHAGVFVRQIATGHARLAGTIPTTVFDNNKIPNATNITPVVQYDPDTNDALKQVLPPQWFPLHFNSIMSTITGNSMIMTDQRSTRVLEIRFNIKENLMAHGLNTPDGIQTMVGFSDWRRAHALQLDLGGNVLSRARVYYPDYVNTLIISGGTPSTRHYYAVVDPLENYIEDNLPVGATPVRSGSNNVIRNLMGGVTYLLQCRYDANNDGYPESILGAGIPFAVPPGPGTVSVGCACGSSTTVGCP